MAYFERDFNKTAASVRTVSGNVDIAVLCLRSISQWPRVGAVHIQESQWLSQLVETTGHRVHDLSIPCLRT